MASAFEHCAAASATFPFASCTAPQASYDEAAPRLVHPNMQSVRIFWIYDNAMQNSKPHESNVGMTRAGCTPNRRMLMASEASNNISADCTSSLLRCITPTACKIMKKLSISERPFKR